jgi:Holliday junction resolvase RusA-like endonuclease
MVPFVLPHRPGAPARASMHASNANELNAWRKKVAELATYAANGAFASADVPVTVQIDFRFEAPKSRPKGRVAMTVAPDVDKLIRACLDGMTLDIELDRNGKEKRRTGVYADDKQVIEVHATKAYSTTLRPPGAYVSVQFADGLDL